MNDYRSRSELPLGTVVGLAVGIPLLVLVIVAPIVGMVAWWASGSGGYGTLGFLAWFVSLVVLLGLGYRLTNRLSEDAPDASVGKSDQAVEALRVAFAQGEVTSDQYQERLTVLTGVQHDQTGTGVIHEQPGITPTADQPP